MSHTLTPAAKLRTVGEALFGDEWQSPLARTVGVDGRTMRFWIAEARPVPDHVVARLPDVMRAEAAARRVAADGIDRLADMIS